MVGARGVDDEPELDGGGGVHAVVARVPRHVRVLAERVLRGHGVEQSLRRALGVALRLLLEHRSGHRAHQPVEALG